MCCKVPLEQLPENVDGDFTNHWTKDQWHNKHNKAILKGVIGSIWDCSY
jgi:hypothetical protein